MFHPLALLAVSLAAGAQNPWLESAKGFYQRLECDRVLAELEQARQVPTNDLPTQLAILDYSGRCQVALGHRPEADAAFSQMLALDPQAEVDPALSPKIRDAFRATKLRLYPADYVALRELPASEGLVRAELVDPWKRVALVVAGRWSQSAQRFEEEPLRPEGNVYLVRLGPGAAWFLEARGPAGEAFAVLGTKAAPAAAPVPVPVLTAPVVASVPAPQAPELVEQPPAPKANPRAAVKWTAVGVGVAAVISGVALWAASGNTHGAAERAAWADDAVALGGKASAERNWGTGILLGGVAVGVAGVVFAW